jgi:lysophospholipase L1-like esterase
VTNAKINELIQKYADNRRVFYKDLSPLFLEPDGKISKTFKPDALHLTPAAYAQWADAILPDIEHLLSVVAPVDRRNVGKWVSRQNTLNQLARNGGFDVMFLGDSITNGWISDGKKVWEEKFPRFKAENFGIGGDQTRHVLWRLRNGNLDGKADPKLVVLMIGTNDTGSKGATDPRHTAAGVKEILDEIQVRKPNAKILLLGIFPRGHDAQNPARVTNAKVNALIQGYADNQRVFYKDIGSVFLESGGKISRTFKPDAVHLTSAAYALWADAILPDIERLLGVSK